MFNFQSETVNNALIQLGEDIDVQKGRPFKSRFIQAGIAGYPKQFGNVLITKETLDGFVHTLVGKPVIINHKDNITKEDEVGKVEFVWFNQEDGWFWCSGYLTDETAINLIKDKHWSVSCSYDVLLLDDEGGTENNIKYDKEFLKGVFTHLAIVENPRYERANIVVNSKTEIVNKESKTMKAENGFITIDGGTPEERVVWVPFEVLSEKARKMIREIANNYKEGQETEYDFSHTRVKPTDEQIKYIKDTVKEIQDNFKFKGIAQINISSELNKGSLGVCCSPDNCSIVSLSPKLYNGNYNQERWDKSVESGFHPKGTGEMIKSVLVHELGHAITCNSKNDTFWSEINTIRKNYMKDVKKNDIKHPDFISGYARTNRFEFVAEAFSQGVLAKNYGKYTKQVMDCINKHFKSEYQTKLFNAKEETKENDDFWAEEYGLGYPIDEEAFEEFNKLQEKGQKNKANNDKEQEMSLLNKLINLIKEVQNSKGEKMSTKDRILNILNEKEVEEETIEEVENEFDEIEKEEKEKEEKEKEVENKKKCKNEKVDKRKLIDEVAGMMKSAGCSDEIIRTAIKDMEKEAYDKSEDDGADNKKAKNEDDKEKDEKEVEKVEKDVKEDVDNKCKNSVYNATDYFNKVNEVYNASTQAGIQNKYETQADRLEAGKRY